MQGLPEDLRKVEAFRQYREIGLILLFQALWILSFLELPASAAAPEAASRKTGSSNISTATTSPW